MRKKSMLIASKLRMLAVLGVVALVMVGSLGLYQLAQVDAASREIRSNWMPSIQYLAEANAALANHRMKTYKHITLSDSSKMRVEEVEMERLLMEAEKNINGYRELAFTDFEKTELGIVEDHLKDYVAKNHEIIKLSRQNLYDSARAIIYTASYEQYTFVNMGIKKLLGFNIEQSQQTTAKSETIFKNSIVIITVFLLLASVAMLSIGHWILKGIKGQLDYLKSVFDKLAVGDVKVTLQANSDDEIGQLSHNIGQVVNNLKHAAEFSHRIGAGDLETKHEVLGNEDVLGISLNNMQQQLKAVAEEDRKRNWSTEGLAQLGEILRAQYNSSQELYDQLIRFLVKYNNAVQGGMFLFNEDSKLIELVGCYAYDRKKYTEKAVAPGDGMLGQVFLEGETQYLLDVPKNYVSITSGLGSANPTSILMVPLKLNENVLGVVEFASLNRFEPYQIALIEKLGESIAAAVTSIKTNERTRQLLQTTQQQAEEMRAQEEEVRQNLEELTATQEEAERKSREFQNRLEIISNSNIGTIEFDLNGVVLNANQSFLDTMGYSYEEVVGKHHRMFVDREFAASEEYSAFWHGLASGKTRFGEFTRFRKGGKPITLHCNYDLIRDHNGKPVKVMKVAVGISKLTLDFKDDTIGTVK
jgi:PAS domain S-box-containing protein